MGNRISQQSRRYIGTSVLWVLTIALSGHFAVRAAFGERVPLVVDFETTPALAPGPAYFIDAGPMQPIHIPGFVTFQGGVVLGSPTTLPAIPPATPPNLYATSNLGHASLQPAILIDIDPAYQVDQVGGLLFNGLRRAADYRVQAFSGDTEVASQALDAMAPNTSGGFGVIAIQGVPITRVTITSDSVIEWDFLVDTMTFNAAVADVPILTAAASRRTHGPGGPAFDLPLSLAPAAPPVIEPRLNGAVPRMVLSFSQPVEAADGSPDCGEEVVVTNGVCRAVTIQGSAMIVDMDYNNACVTVELSGLRGAGGGFDLLGVHQVRVSVQPGNVNGDGVVNILDLRRIKGELYQPVTDSNFRFDLNVSGMLDILDLQSAKNNFLPQATCP